MPLTDAPTVPSPPNPAAEDEDAASESLQTEHLAIVSALGGANSALDMLRAHVHDSGGEHRPQQEEMLNEVEDSVRSGRHLLIQAGTGTGKSLAYGFAAAASGKTTVIATATNQLSEQLTMKDFPQIAALMGRQKRDLVVATLKGRNQYVCRARLRESQMLEPANGDTLFSALDEEVDSSSATDGERFAQLAAWATVTESGERSEAPAVPDRLWRQISVGAAECARSECPFFSDCFAEKARGRARKANVVITNHALLAQDVRLAVESVDSDQAPPLLPPHDVLILDEAHAFAATLSDALSTTVDVEQMRQRIKKSRKLVDLTDEANVRMMTKCADAIDGIEEALRRLSPGVLEGTPESLHHAFDAAIVQLLFVSKSLREQGQRLTRENKPRKGTAAMLMANQIDADALAVSRCRSTPPGAVRWVEVMSDDRPPMVKVAPIEVGEQFLNALESRTVIGTSATLAVAGSFEVAQRLLGLQSARCADVGTPFEYPKQGMLYIPRPPFPEPVGKERREHSAAVLDELEALVEAAGGRTLALFTTVHSATRAAEHLRKAFPGLTILAHGEAPAESLVRDFTQDETSVLCATMGMWQGVSVEGPSCSLVVIDKISFPPPDDALTQARKEFADGLGRDGFGEVFVAKAAIDLAQAAGRLIRTQSDRGVVAVLDPRLLSKNYGKVLLGSLPNFPLYTDRNTVTAALTRLTGGLPDGARKRKSRSKAAKPTAKRSPVAKPGVKRTKRRVPRG